MGIVTDIFGKVNKKKPDSRCVWVGPRAKEFRGSCKKLPEDIQPRTERRQ